MRTSFTLSCLFVLGALLTSGAQAQSSESLGWFPAGSDPKEYKMDIVSNEKHSGSNAAMIKFTASDAPTGFGTYMQMHQPGEWAGKKLKMTGYVKTEDIDGWCGMWCRVDGADGKEMVDFDNMGDRPIKGTTDWTKYEIIINVSKDASAIAYGVLVGGKGTAYFDDITFEVLGAAEKSEKLKTARSFPAKPTNLNFELNLNNK